MRGMNTAAVVLAGLVASLALSGLAPPAAAQTNAAPKKLLVVSVTKGYRHASIETGLKVLADLAAKSGQFTVDYAGTDAELAVKMTPAALKNYDGVFFLSTTGDLPLPDKAAFLDWIKAGGAFIGAHAATDTFHSQGDTADPYIEMIGGEFVSHVVAPVECINDDPTHPATRFLGKTWAVTDEIYVHKFFSRDHVHMLLSLDRDPATGQPGFVPIAWCKKYGRGNVFYTALGHPDDMWLNPDFQRHILGGIQWALGLEPGDATPQTPAKN
jgi:type 1 glutamine amidotransferase